MAALLYLWLASPLPSRGDWRAWVHTLPESFPHKVFGSSHFAHALVWATTVWIREYFPHAAASAPMHFLSRVHGMVYLAAALILASTFSNWQKQAWTFLLAVFTPMSLFFLGYVEIGHWPMAWICLGLANMVARPRNALGAILPMSVAVALHGLGLFFLPMALAFVFFRWRGKEKLLVASSLFAASGAAFTGYIVLFKDATILPGDAHGGANGSLLLKFSSPWLWNSVHLKSKALVLMLGVPSLVAISCFFNHRQKTDAALALSALCGLAFVAAFNTAFLGWLFDADMLFPALAPLHLLFLRRSVAERFLSTPRNGFILIWGLSSLCVLRSWLLSNAPWFNDHIAPW